ncbi:MAG: TetR/AcrR family transcriptional regulator [Myxococcota bacterium]|nr:TetR/AcrR family transcriptional regulator [Myxococcota bacterium]
MSRPPATAVPDRRQLLLQHAEDAFGEFGYAGARIQEIAERAGIRRPSLLHHFADKETLYAQVVAGIVGELLQRVERSQANSPSGADAEGGMDAGTPSGPARIETVVMVWVDFLVERPNAARVLLRHMIDPLTLPDIAASVAQLLSSIQEAIDLGVARGENKEQDAAEFALVLASTSLVWVSTRGAVEGALGMDTLSPEKISSHRELLRQLARQLLGAVTALR